MEDPKDMGTSLPSFQFPQARSRSAGPGDSPSLLKLLYSDLPREELWDPARELL